MIRRPEITETKQAIKTWNAIGQISREIIIH